MKTVPAVDSTSIKVSCDSGDAAIGGGAQGLDQGNTQIRESWPVDARTWETRANSGPYRGINTTITVHVWCADLTP